MNSAAALRRAPRPEVLSKASVYLLLWVLTPLVTALGAKTSFPNQIYVGFELLQVCLCALFFRSFFRVVSAAAKWLAVVLLYAVVFIVVSYYGVDFSTSVEYGVLYLPAIVLLEFFLAFSVGYLYPYETTFRYMMKMALVLVAYTLVEIVLSPDQSRFVSTLNVPMAIPLFVFSGSNLTALLCMLVLLLSLKKTIVVVGGMSLVGSYFLRRYVREADRPRRERMSRRALISAVVGGLTALAAAGVILVYFSSYISGTFDRFSEEEDVSRASIALYSYILLAQNFPQGIGWFGFLYLSADVIPYTSTTARGDVLGGANLHSTYMTWALEGGAPILAIVLFLFISLWRAVWSFLRRHATRQLGATLLIWLLGGMILGAFQQWHSSGTFWELFGFAFGCYARYRAAS